MAAAVAVAEPGALYARSLAEATGMPDNRVQKQPKRFETAGLLVRMPQVAGERGVFYERLGSGYWEAATLLLQEWQANTHSAFPNRRPTNSNP